MKKPIYNPRVFSLDKICFDDDFVLLDSSAFFGRNENNSAVTGSFVNCMMEQLMSLDNLYVTYPIFRECLNDLENSGNSCNKSKIFVLDDEEKEIYRSLYEKHLKKKEDYGLTTEDYDFVITGVTSFMKRGITSMVTNDLGLVDAGFSVLKSEKIPRKWLRFFGRIDYDSFARVLELKNFPDSNKSYKESVQ